VNKEFEKLTQKIQKKHNCIINIQISEKDLRIVPNSKYDFLFTIRKTIALLCNAVKRSQD
jgi:hypothetical protein